MKLPASSMLFIMLLWTMAANSQSVSMTGQNMEIEVAPDLSKSFRSYQIYQIDSKTLWQNTSQNDGNLTIHMELGEDFDLYFDLKPTRLRAADYFITQSSSRELPLFRRSENKTFSGHITGANNSTVALTLDIGFIYGFFESKGTTWFIEPLSPPSQNSIEDLFIVYKASDVLANERPCAFDQLAKAEKKMPDFGSIEKNAGACHLVEIAIATDWLLFDYFGNPDAVENFVLGNLNMVQSNYDDEFEAGIQFELVTLFISDCDSCDPWANTTDPYILLQVFRNRGNSGGFGTSFDVASMWSKREFDGDLVGLAWPGALCANNRYNILQHYTENAASLRVLQSHELGHNFSASHDEAGDYTIMAPSVTTSMEWSASSLEVINMYIDYIANNFDCFDDCPAPSIPIAQMQIPVTHVCPGSMVPFIAAAEGATSWSWNFGTGIPPAGDQNPKTVFEEPGTYPIQLIVSNDSGADTITNQNIQVDPAGTKILFFETFESPPNDWIIFNPNNNTPFLWYPVAGQPFGKYAMMIDNYNNPNVGQLDAIVSPSFSLVGESNIFLEFDYAYSRRNESQLDTFRILLSEDGGASFPHLLVETVEDGSGNFATVADSESFFTPQHSDDWCADFGTQCFAIPLDQFSGASQVKLMFLNETGSGNNLYLDNIRVVSSCNFVEPATPDFIGETTIGCAPFTATFIDNSSGVIDNLIWQFESGIPGFSTSSNPSILFPNPGTYDVSLTVFNDAGNFTKTEEDYISVLPVAVADFSYSQQALEVSFTNNAAGAETFLWNFGNDQSSNDPDPTVTFLSEGVYTVTLITSNACSIDTFQQEISLFLTPEASFSVSDQEICTNGAVSFSAQPGQNDYAYTWTFEGGTPAFSNEINPTVIYDQAGSFTVELIVSNPAGSDTLMLDQFITVEESPQATFSTAVDPGGGTVVFTNETSGNAFFYWDFGDGQNSTAQNPVHEYTEEGMFSVTLVTENNCGVDTFIQMVNIIFEPQADFSYSANTNCVPALIAFNNESTGSEATYQWFFEGGTPAQSNEINPSVNYHNSGQFDVTLIVTNAAGVDTLTEEQLILLDTLPAPGFIWEEEGLVIQFTNLSQNADQYQWAFGDLAQSNELMPVHTYTEPGIFVVSLWAFNQCGVALATDTIDLSGTPPEVSINYETNSGCAPLTVAFFAEQTNADSLAWHFEGGNPDFSNELNPVITFETPGSFGISLSGYNIYGNSFALIPHAITVLDLPVAGFEFEQAAGTVNFYNTSENGTAYFWSFGDEALSDAENPSQMYLESGSFEVQLVVSNACGTDTLAQEINIIIDDVFFPEAIEEVKVFPNPSSGLINIYFPKETYGNSTESFLLFDALGRKVHHQSLAGQNTKISLLNLPKGIYFYEISNEGYLINWGELIIL